MADMRRIIIVLFASLSLALVLPAVAPATLSELGVIGATAPVTVPSCPSSPCLAVSRTTGFQARVGSARSLLSVPRTGTIVAWTISLGKPSATQIRFFNANEGGVAEAGVRLKGSASGGVLELFMGFEKRVDAYELERDSRRWVLAGFRLLSR